MPLAPVLRWMQRIVLGLVILIAVGVLAFWLWSRPATPDAFYKSPDGMPGSPGKLIRSEPYTRSVPQGARGWRVLYSTTDLNNRPTIASAIIVAPEQTSQSPQPIIAWNHGFAASKSPERFRRD